ncbi:MAG TPA: hypothetical protein PLB99_12925 [Thermotogota bacterium]|nr:hypothetical protein [Thermotogota bacterium]
MPDVFELSIDKIQPSQLYISKEKMMAVQRWLHSAETDYQPIPVKSLNGNIIYTDGHTRAFVLFKLGAVKIRVYWDQDDLDWEAYQICVDWCAAERIFDVSHLKDRLLDGDQYEHLWHDRCRAMQAQLQQKRSVSH